MSNPGNLAPPSPMPSITGNPAIDTLLRNFIISLAAAVTGILVNWLKDHGVNDPNLTLVLSATVASALTTFAGIGWAVWQTKTSQRAIVNNAIHAAATGEISQAVASKATPEQLDIIESSPRASISTEGAKL